MIRTTTRSCYPPCEDAILVSDLLSDEYSYWFSFVHAVLSQRRETVGANVEEWWFRNIDEEDKAELKPIFTKVMKTLVDEGWVDNDLNVVLYPVLDQGGDDE